MKIMKTELEICKDFELSSMLENCILFYSAKDIALNEQLKTKLIDLVFFIQEIPREKVFEKGRCKTIDIYEYILERPRLFYNEGLAVDIYCSYLEVIFYDLINRISFDEAILYVDKLNKPVYLYFSAPLFPSRQHKLVVKETY